MKSKNLFLALLILTFTISCKNEENSKTTENTIEMPVVKENFNVELDVIAETQDDFTVYYTENNTNEFDGVKAVWSGVKGGSNSEKIVIDLPEEVIPTNIRLDFGIKKDRKDVIIQNIKFSFYGKSFNIKGHDLLNYFTKSDLLKTEVDTVNGTSIIKANPDADGTYFYPKQELLDEIAKLTK